MSWKEGLEKDKIKEIKDYFEKEISTAINERASKLKEELKTAQTKIDELETSAINAETHKALKDELAKFKKDYKELETKFTSADNELKEFKSKNSELKINETLAKYKFKENELKIVKKLLNPESEDLDKEIQETIKEYGFNVENPSPNVENPSGTGETPPEENNGGVDYYQAGHGIYK